MAQFKSSRLSFHNIRTGLQGNFLNLFSINFQNKSTPCLTLMTTRIVFIKVDKRIVGTFKYVGNSQNIYK